MKLNQLTIKQSLEGLQRKRFSSRELAEACLRQIEKTEGSLKSFVTMPRDYVLEQAREADRVIQRSSDIWERAPLTGIPVAVKDNFCTKGLKTTASSKVLENYVPVYDATVIKLLRKAGAIILGKTNMDAWAHGSSTETSDFHTTRNPWDTDRTPGGSSGGSAASVAAHQTIFAIGSETAGSIRQPASWCGVTGFKPTYGRVSRYGVIAMGSSLDCPGPLTKTAEDALLVVRALAGKDEKDATTAEKDFSFSLGDVSPKKLVIGLPRTYFFDGLDEEVEEGVRRAVGRVKKAGAQIKEVDLLDPQYSVAVYTVVQRSEVSSNLARYDGVRYGRDRSFFGDEAKRRVMLGTYALSAGYYDKYYKKAQKVRSLICSDFDKVFEEVDLLIAPTTPTPALKVGAADKDPMFGEMQDMLVEASSLAGLPGISIPCGFTKAGLPIGMQIMGPQWSEGLLLEVAHRYQQTTDWHQRKPEI